MEIIQTTICPNPEPCRECGRYPKHCDCHEPRPDLTSTIVAAKYDNVQHPSHYCAGRKYEPADVIEDWGLSKDWHLGNALKYIARAGRKGDLKEDVSKAIWYLQRRVTLLEEEAANEGQGTSR